MADKLLNNEEKMSNDPFNLNDLLKNAGKLGDLLGQSGGIADAIKETQHKINAIQVTGTAGLDSVKIQLNGHHEATNVTIDPSILSEDRTVLEELIAAAINDAMSKLNKEKQATVPLDPSAFFSEEDRST